MKTFVTGATGFIGGHLVRALVARGDQVAAVVRHPAKAQDLASLGVELHQGDITDRESLRAAMTGVDAVFHLAAWYKIGASDKSDAEQINVGGTRNVLELMRDLRIPKGVYTSTVAIFSDTHGQPVDESYRFRGKHLSEYDRTKAEAHEVALSLVAVGLPLVIVQPGVVYGPGDPSAMGETLRLYLQRKLPIVPQQTAFAWGYVDDIVQGHLLALDKGKVGEDYIIAGPIYTLIDALKIAEGITGIPAPRTTASPGMMKAMAALTGLIEPMVHLPDIYTSERLRVSAGVTYIGSNAKARRELGYSPRRLEDGFKLTLPYEMEKLEIKAKM